MAFFRDADAEKMPEAESLLHEEQGHGRRRTEPVIPPAADLYPATDQAHHVRYLLYWDNDALRLPFPSHTVTPCDSFSGGCSCKKQQWTFCYVIYARWWTAP